MLVMGLGEKLCIYIYMYLYALHKDSPEWRFWFAMLQDTTDELENYQSVIAALHDQADGLGEQDKENTEVLSRLGSIDRRYQELLELAKIRKQRLLDALALYKLFNEADGVEQWISEKEKLLGTMTPTDDMEEIEILKARFETFNKEMKDNEDKMETVSTLSRQLIQNEHPNSDEVVAREKQVNQRWEELRNLADAKRSGLDLSHNVNTWHIECQETMTWIREKAKLVESTDELGSDLTGVMTLQRRLSGLERDLAAIQAKLDSLQSDADRLAEEKPEEAEAIQAKIVQVTELWQELKQMVSSSMNSVLDHCIEFLVVLNVCRFTHSIFFLTDHCSICSWEMYFSYVLNTELSIQE